MRRIISIIGCTALVGSAGLLAGATPAAASANQGVTATTIKVGIPYVDLAAVDQQFGLKINQGSFPDAYTALFDQINARGGINGRKIVPVFVAVNPTGTAAAASSCTQLTENDNVFVSFAPLSPICYLEHDTPTIGSTVTGSVNAGSAQNFTLVPPANDYDPTQLAVLDKQGVFKGKKVGVFGGEITDEPEVGVVDAALKKDHVAVVQTAVDSAPSSDLTAEDQQQAVIAQRFKNDGVNEIVAVGTGSAAWPQAEDTNQASYNPPWVATSETDLAGVLTGESFPSQYLTKAVATYPETSQANQWSDPLIQKCVKTVKQAYPSDAIASPVGQSASDTSDDTYVSVMGACTNVALFDAIAQAAGKHLTVASFTQAGYGLRDLRVPGDGTVSFGAGQAYALGPVYLAHYDATTKLFQLASKPVSG
jgi:Periplasmic binding protein